VDIQRMQQSYNLRPNLEQSQFAREMQQAAAERQLKVNQAAAAEEGTRIREDASDEPAKHSNPRYRRFSEKKRRSAADEPDGQDSEPEPGHHIDIRI
jgi:hypothetical protein